MLVALLARAERPGSSKLERERAAVLRSAAMWRPQAEYQRALEVVEVEYDATLSGLRSKLIEIHWVPSTAPAIPRRHAKEWGSGLKGLAGAGPSESGSAPVRVGV